MVSEKNAAVSYLEEKRAGEFGSLMRGIGHGARKAMKETIGLQGPQGLAKTYRVGRGIGGTAGEVLIGSGLVAAGTGAAELAAMSASKLYDAATKARDFNSMLEYDPELGVLHQENPSRVNQMFSTLRMFNPDFTRDPVVSSQYVKRMVEDPAHAGETAVGTLEHVGKVRPMIGSHVFGGKNKKKK